MKLFIVAALVSVAAAGRLEHLERSYLPPDQGSSQGHYASQSAFGSQGHSNFGSSGLSNGGLGGAGAHGSFGSAGSHGSFGGAGSSSFDTNGIETQAFPGATINQYLPPNHGPSGANGAQFAGSLQGFGSQRSQYTPQSSFGSASQYSAPSTQYGAPSSFGSQGHGQQFGQGSNQFAATNRQYLAPKSSSNYPQQAFDEQTGYHY